jgi:hypothetical protein
MRLNKIFAAGLCLTLIAPAFADLGSIEPGVLRGDFYFYTYAQKNGKPVCSERWRFGDDGILTIFNGQEVLTEHFRVEEREAPFENSTKTWKSSRLLASDAVSNGLPDCLGHTNSGFTALEDVIYRAEDGSIVLCRLFTKFMSCYGHLYRASDVDAVEKKAEPAR